MTIRWMLLSLLPLLPCALTADDAAISTTLDNVAREAVYESIDGVHIGRVFFSVTERERLDVYRQKLPRAASKRAAKRSSARAATSAAGFIIDRSGAARVFRDGEFVPSKGVAEAMRFPGDIRIIRHTTTDEASDQDAGDPGDAR